MPPTSSISIVTTPPLYFCHLLSLFPLSPSLSVHLDYSPPRHHPPPPPTTTTPVASHFLSVSPLYALPSSLHLYSNL